MANDTWRTPPEVFNYFNNIYDFKVDCCASDDNHLCASYITEREDFLNDYNGSMLKFEVGGYHFCNPPYSNPLVFVKRAVKLSQYRGVGFAILLNHDLSTKVGTLLSGLQCKHIPFFGGRMAFLNENNEPVKGNSKGQIIYVIPPFVENGKPIYEPIALDYVMNYGKELAA